MILYGTSQLHSSVLRILSFNVIRLVKYTINLNPSRNLLLLLLGNTKSHTSRLYYHILWGLFPPKPLCSVSLRGVIKPLLKCLETLSETRYRPTEGDKELNLGHLYQNRVESNSLAAHTSSVNRLTITLRRGDSRTGNIFPF